MSHELVFFTHIPKTSGTTFFESSILPNIEDSKYYNVGSFKKAFSDRISGKLSPNKVEFVAGHIKYGMHYIFNCDPKYIVFLRHPIERAISFYYFIRDSDVTIYRHRLRDYADSVSIEEFYQNPRFSNMICQYIGGYGISAIYKQFSGVNKVNELLLKKASENLFNRYSAYGILEYFEESCTLIRNQLSFNNFKEVSTLRKRTKKRPNLVDLSESTLASLRRSHELDIELYNRAKTKFLDKTSCDFILQP